MAIRNEIVNRANAIVGMNRDQLQMSGEYAWCAHTVSNVLRYVGITDMYDLSCNSMKAKMSKDHKWSEPDDAPIPGDVIFFDWDRERDPEYYTRPLDHVGIVTGYNNGNITYVNGNGSSAYYVTKQNIHIDNPSVSYWMRWVGDNNEDVDIPKTEVIPKQKTFCTVELEQLDKGCESASVETLQNLLIDLGYNVEADGKFGNETDRIVKQFQKDYKLESDGIVGANTWKALIEAV